MPLGTFRLHRGRPLTDRRTLSAGAGGCGLVVTVTGGVVTLAEAFTRIPQAESDWEGRHRLALVQGGSMSLADLVRGGDHLALLVATKQRQASGGDQKLGCAYLIGDLAWEAGRLFAGLWLEGWHLCAADPDALALTLRAVDWEEDGLSGTAQVIDLTVDPAGLSGGPADPSLFARAFGAMFEGLVPALTQLTGLGPAAQWRLVADGLSGAILDRGKAMGMVPRALALGRAVQADRMTRLWSKQGEFVEITAPPDLTEWFRLRSGCCRYYTAEGGEYCTTCVHRDRTDQIDRLQAHLQAKSLAQPAR